MCVGPIHDSCLLCKYNVCMTFHIPHHEKWLLLCNTIKLVIVVQYHNVCMTFRISPHHEKVVIIVQYTIKSGYCCARP